MDRPEFDPKEFENCWTGIVSGVETFPVAEREDRIAKRFRKRQRRWRRSERRIRRREWMWDHGFEVALSVLAFGSVIFAVAEWLTHR